MEQNYYSNAPIMEAILDIQVESRKGLTLSSLAACQDSVLVEYPTKRELKSTTAHFETGTKLATLATSEHIGYAYLSPDGKQLFQVRMNGFTANRLAPYARWESFSQEARRLWNIYRELAKPVRITRLALRYINRIDIPTTPVELKDYFNTSPEVAQGLPQSMAGFFMQVLLPLEDEKAFVNIVETIVDPPHPGTVSVVLDLDLFRTEDLAQSDDELWYLLDKLRKKKNAIFDMCITEKTKELIR